MAKKQAAAVDIRHFDVVRGPHITEKSTMASENNAVVFRVANDATKPQNSRQKKRQLTKKKKDKFKL